ncbi:MAG: DUF3054 domain-containing protein [Nocardioides sp.]
MTLSRSVVVAAMVDVVLVLIFAATGRASHDEAVLSGLARTAWPFLAGLALGWVAARAWASPRQILPTAVIIWSCTVAVGMVLRAASGQGTAFSFVVVATIVLGVFLLGWRAIAAAAAR